MGQPWAARAPLYRAGENSRKIKFIMYLYIDIYKKGSRWYFQHRGYSRMCPETVTTADEARNYVHANFKTSHSIKIFEAQLLS